MRDRYSITLDYIRSRLLVPRNFTIKKLFSRLYTHLKKIRLSGLDQKLADLLNSAEKKKKNFDEEFFQVATFSDLEIVYNYLINLNSQELCRVFAIKTSDNEWPEIIQRLIYINRQEVIN